MVEVSPPYRAEPLTTRAVPSNNLQANNQNFMNALTAEPVS